MAKGERTRKDIIEHAFILASELGLESVSLGVLATQSGMSKSGLFAHFKSKEALQLAVIDEAVARFARIVVHPALREPRGERRVRMLFERYQFWKSADKASGCIFMSLSHEYDDRPGMVRDRLVTAMREWYEVICRVVESAIEAKYFRADLDADLFAFEFVGIAMSFHHAGKMLQLPRAGRLQSAAFEALLDRCRAPNPPSNHISAPAP